MMTPLGCVMPRPTRRKQERGALILASPAGRRQALRRPGPRSGAVSSDLSASKYRMSLLYGIRDYHGTYGLDQRWSRGFESASGRLKTQVGGSPRAPKKRSTPPENSSWEVSNANFFSLRDKTQVGGFKPARAPARIAQSLTQAPSSRHPSCTRSPRAVRPQRGDRAARAHLPERDRPPVESLRTPHPVFLNTTIRRLKLSAGTGG